MDFSFLRAVECYVNHRHQPYTDDVMIQEDLYNRLSEFEDVSEHHFGQHHLARIDELQNELAMTLDQWTAMSIVFTSTKETFTESSVLASQATDDVSREMRAACDIIMAQIRKLEKQINLIEEQIQAVRQDAQRVVAIASP
jgi:hypothetical protein